MKPKTASKFLTSSLILSIVLSISGCGGNANLAKIREFSKLTTSAKEELPKIANDVYISCLREARYRAVSTLPTESKIPAADWDRLSTSLININNKQQIGDRLDQRTDAQKECERTAGNLGPKMKQGNGIVIAYMETLGAVASDDRIDFDPEFNELKTNIEKLRGELGSNFLDPKQVNAGLNI